MGEDKTDDHVATDYHDFVNLDTPKKERRRLNVGDLFVNAAKCTICGKWIRSKNRHDYVVCACKNLSVDGGSWYARRGFKNHDSYINDIVYFNDVETDVKRTKEG